MKKIHEVMTKDTAGWPEKVLQFGEGNFLRAFVNYWFDISNEKAGWNGKCVLIQPIAQGLTDLINKITHLTYLQSLRKKFTGLSGDFFLRFLIIYLFA